MKSTLRIIITSYLLLITYYLSTAQIAINTDGTEPDASAMLDVSSTDKGILIPRMTTAERTAISNPATGLMVYDSDENNFWYYNGSAWTAVGQSVFTSENGITHTINNSDDFIVGTDSINYGGSGSEEQKLFFDKSNGAFRAGQVTTTNWDTDTIGTASVAFGTDNDASFLNSSAFGFENSALAKHSFVAGRESQTYGNVSIAMGLGLAAQAKNEFAIGSYNTTYTANKPAGFDNADRVFVIGNGTDENSRSDAMIVYKNGNTEVNGQFMASDDFLVGVDSINHIGGSTHEYKVIFDKSQAAFRTGRIYNTNWDEDSLGLYSFATGTNTLATGNNSTALGYQSLASGTHSFAGGNSSEATGAIAFTFGREVYAPSYGEVAFGLYGTSYTANETSAFNTDDRLFSLGNGTASNSRSDAMVVYKSGNAEINGQLTVSDTLKLLNALTINDNLTIDGGRIEIINTGNSVFIGEGAGQSDDYSNNKNILIGYQSGYVNTTGNDNIFLGYQSGYDNTTGSDNIFLGYRSGYNNITGYDNMFLGYENGYSNTTGKDNIFLGFRSGYFNTGGSNNTFIGYTSGYNNTTGVDNTFLGYYSGFSNTTGDYNTCLGHDSGRNNTTGSSNVFIGYRAGYNETGSNKLYIDNSNTSSPLIYGEFNTNRVVINGNSSDNSNNRRLFVNGSIGATSSFNNDSDRRLKTNIQTIPNALDKVLEMRGVTYEWKDGREKGDRMGFIAQEVEPILPEVVDNANDHYTMQYAPITAVLVEAVKEQQAQINELKIKLQEVEELKQQNTEMKAMLEQIQQQLKNQ